MSFEIRSKDLLGRIGRLETKRGTLETPVLLPVVNPNIQLIEPSLLRERFGFNAIITNAYILWKRFREEKRIPPVHQILGFDGVIETDSGAYQILRYGAVEVEPSEIIKFQERLDPEIGVILDVPTGDSITRDRAESTVRETLRRADEAIRIIKRKDILWVGPVQGGVNLDLVAYSAREISKRDFPIHALGSPTVLMESYQFETLVDMIIAAKVNLPPDRPLHLFGGGNPSIFALAVALGCDIFDSSSYALYARGGRYMTMQGTMKLEELEYFPCSCAVCSTHTPEKVRGYLPTERERFLASHNLHTCRSELEAVKQAIVDGRLWELVELRCKAHPALQRALYRLTAYSTILKDETPVTKRRGLFLLGFESLNRPEILTHQEKLLENYRPPRHAKLILLIPEERIRSFQFDNSKNFFLKALAKRRDINLLFYGVTFGLAPYELLDVYPLSQRESALRPTRDAVDLLSKRIAEYLVRVRFKSCIIVGSERWQAGLARRLRRKLKAVSKIEPMTFEGSDEELNHVIMKVSWQERSKPKKLNSRSK